METKTKNWSTGTGSATIQYGGQGDGEIIVTSDPNSLYESRSMQIVVGTTDGSGIQKTITINQAAKQRIDISNAVITASNQTYSGSAKTPTPTVTLNGTIIPSSGYDVAYSNNINSGTATITVTGKGDYTGTASGTFTIAKASRTLSFADSYMVLNTSSTGTKTATPSAGSGDGAITYSIANTTYATINSSTGAVTSKTSDGSVIVTATIAEGQNYLGATATYTLYVFATTHNYSYNGSYRSVTLPPGTYQFQVWGAQGGSNAADSSYGITSKAGGKGGYSVGQLTIPQSTGVRVYVGGQGTSENGGFNGGGNAPGGGSWKNSDNEEGYSLHGGGGGASDIRLSDGSLNSRMIVAGGGSGGAMCCRKVTNYIEEEETIATYGNSSLDVSHGLAITSPTGQWVDFPSWAAGLLDIRSYVGKSAYITWANAAVLFIADYPSNGDNVTYIALYQAPSNKKVTIPSGAKYMAVASFNYYKTSQSFSMTVVDTVQKPVVTTDYAYQVGFAGGGINGDGYSSTYKGKQNSAGNLAEFGVGATQYSKVNRYTSAAGGGGWYGGGREYSNNDINAVKMSGGGSGFVNTAASAGNRPSGYTGLELDSGETYAGNTSFPAPGGGNETGHSGDGYIRITRIS